MSVQACVWLAVSSLLCPYLALTCLGKRSSPFRSEGGLCVRVRKGTLLHPLAYMWMEGMQRAFLLSEVLKE